MKIFEAHKSQFLKTATVKIESKLSNDYQVLVSLAKKETIKLWVVQTQVVLILKSMSERDASDREQLKISVSLYSFYSFSYIISNIDFKNKMTWAQLPLDWPEF